MPQLPHGGTRTQQHVWLRTCHNDGVSESTLNKSMVMVADDDLNIRLLVSATLASDRYSVIEAADGEVAWHLIRQHRPAVVILDWEMPIYKGLELTAVIKGDPQLCGTKVVMLTGRATRADREAGARAKADVYLVKPFSPEELLKTVEQALGNS
jgi:DNA-binding response OmpR family regulator